MQPIYCLKQSLLTICKVLQRPKFTVSSASCGFVCGLSVIARVVPVRVESKEARVAPQD